jgi:hypothetical protein
MGVVGSEVCVDAAVGENKEGILFAAIDVLGNENIAVKFYGIFRPHSRGIFLVRIGRACDPHFIDKANIPDPMVPEDIINSLFENIKTMLEMHESLFQKLQVVFILTLIDVAPAQTGNLDQKQQKETTKKDTYPKRCFD